MDISQDKLEITLDVAGELEGEDLKPLKEAMVCYYESLPKDGQSQGWKQEVQDIVMFCGALIYVMTHHIKQLILTGLIGQDEDQLSRIIVIVGSSSICVTFLITPIIVSLSRRKSTRLLAILGGLVCSLGVLFTSFATQFHQLFFSYGVIIGSGVSLTRGTASIVVGQYFKKRRELVEIFVISGTGVGMAVMPLVVTHAISVLGWRLGLQAITGMTSLTFILGIFYRPASLYHPQRRAILHLKGLQKRSKAKDKNAQKEKPPFFDFTVLKSRTVQILVTGSSLSAFGISAPIMLLIHQGKEDGLDHSTLLLLQAYLGLSSCLGTAALGFVVVKNSMQCLIARQYLTQASLFVMGGGLLSFISLRDPSGYTLFACVYGFFYGGYLYSLKTFTFEKVRARNFARAWGFIQCSHALPMLIGVPLTGYLNESYSDRVGFYFASACIFTGGFILFFIDVHKRNVKRQKSHTLSSNFDPSDSECKEKKAYYNRRVSLQDLAAARIIAKHRIANELMHKQELTCISEEVIMDNFIDDYVDDCITSCNKEEKYLMLSEFENNLINTQESSSVSQEVIRLAKERKVSSASPTLLEHCPNCLRIVPLDGETACVVETQKKTHVSRSSAKKKTASRRKDDKSVANADIIDEVTSSL